MDGPHRRILVGDDDDFDAGWAACETMLRELTPTDAAHLSLYAFAGVTHEFDVFDSPREFYDPAGNRCKGGTIHVRPDPRARQQACDDLTQFFPAV